MKLSWWSADLTYMRPWGLSSIQINNKEDDKADGVVHNVNPKISVAEADTSLCVWGKFVYLESSRTVGAT